MDNRFVHLHLHTEYSLVDGLIEVELLVEAALNDRALALAVTEQGNLFSLVKFYRQAQKRGIKPLIGAELRLFETSSDRENSHILLLCQNETGYHNLTRLVTRSYVEGQHQGVPHIRRDWLEGHTDGLIALSCAREGNIGKAVVNHNLSAAAQYLQEWLQLFPDRFYLELQRTGRAYEDTWIEAAVSLAQQYDAPIVATNDVRFLVEADFEAHEARVCIQSGYTLGDVRRPREYSPQQYLKTSAQMCELFSDLPEAIENTLLIAQRCNLEFRFGKYHLPDFPVPEGHNQDSWLQSEAERGLDEMLVRLAARPDNRTSSSPEHYRQRLAFELNTIRSMGFSGYFLIVADFITWAKQQDIPVGPGRGSGAGSLVAYVLGITELDPLHYDLLFERFLNPERISLPDFDIDFCMERRDEVIEYVAMRYGHDHVSQIITFGRMAAKAVIRDVGRILNHPYGFVDQIAKLVPFDLNMTLDKALEDEQLLKQRYEQEDDVRSLIDLAKKLEGLSRNAGKHAGGIVIAPQPLTEYMPLYCEQGTSVTSTQFDMGDVEAMGLVKFDFLGLRTLTIIDWAVKDINRILEPAGKLRILDIPHDDPATYELIQRMDTTAIFQLESDGMKKLIKRLRPDAFNDLIALVALFRPGPLQSGMVDDFIDRKHGHALVKYPHPALEEILKPTYGVILYQEQVMQIAQVLAGYTLGAADLLRRAMGKKKPEEMAEQRAIFVEGAVNKQVDRRVATGIFDLMEKFAGYGFNKSHSAAYALLSYQTAWLKTHYPSAFMAAVLSSDMDNTDKIVSLREEVNRMQLQLLPPSANDSFYKFTVVDRGTIRFGLGAIKGAGKAAIDNIIEERESGGKFRDLFEFCKRLDSRKVNKRVVEALIKSGAVDDLGPGRAVMLASLGKAMQFAEQFASNNSTGQDDLFGLELTASTGTSADAEFVDAKEHDEHERLRAEKETLGFYLQGHPISRYEPELLQITTAVLGSVSPGVVRIAGYIESIRTRSGQRGRMAEVRIDDRTARMHVNLYSEVYEKYRAMLQKDKLVIICGEAVADDYYESGMSVKADKIADLADIRANCGTLVLRLDRQMMQNGTLNLIKGMLSDHAAGRNCPVRVEYTNGTAKGTLALGNEWRVEISDNLLQQLAVLVGADNVNVRYRDVHRYLAPATKPKLKFISGSY